MALILSSVVKPGEDGTHLSQKRLTQWRCRAIRRSGHLRPQRGDNILSERRMLPRGQRGARLIQHPDHHSGQRLQCALSLLVHAGNSRGRVLADGDGEKLLNGKLVDSALQSQRRERYVK